eukprot:jgi/Bigna1/84465/fgenesh1_pg.140_\
MWVGVWSPPAPEPHSWTPVGWTDTSPQPPVTRQPDEGRVDLCSRFKVAFGKKLPPVTWQPNEGCMDLHSRFKVAFAEMALGGGFFGCEGGFSPHPCTTFLFTGGAGHRRIGCQVKDFRICIQCSPRMNPVRMKVSSSNFVPSRQCLHWAGDVVVGVKPVLPIAMMGALSPQKPGMLCEGNVSAKAGDVVAGVKQTTKVWSMGLFSWGSQDLGMRGPEVGTENNETRNGGVATMPFLIPFGFTGWSSLKRKAKLVRIAFDHLLTEASSSRHCISHDHCKCHVTLWRCEHNSIQKTSPSQQACRIHSLNCSRSTKSSSHAIRDAPLHPLTTHRRLGRVVGPFSCAQCVHWVANATGVATDVFGCDGDPQLARIVFVLPSRDNRVAADTIRTRPPCNKVRSAASCWDQFTILLGIGVFVCCLSVFFLCPQAAGHNFFEPSTQRLFVHNL